MAKLKDIVVETLPVSCYVSERVNKIRLRNAEKLPGTAYDKRCQRRIYKRSNQAE